MRSSIKSGGAAVNVGLLGGGDLFCRNRGDIRRAIAIFFSLPSSRLGTELSEKFRFGGEGSSNLRLS